MICRSVPPGGIGAGTAGRGCNCGLGVSCVANHVGMASSRISNRPSLIPFTPQPNLLTILRSCFAPRGFSLRSPTFRNRTASTRMLPKTQIPFILIRELLERHGHDLLPSDPPDDPGDNVLSRCAKIGSTGSQPDVLSGDELCNSADR